MKRDYFPSKADYDNYLEECQDIIYDLTHGNDTIKRAAEDKTEELRRKYQALLVMAQKEKLSKEAQLAHTAHLEDIKFAIPKIPAPSSNIIFKPDVTEGMALPAVSIFLSSVPGRTVNLEVTKKASGYMQTHEIRNVLEALDGIFIF